MSLTLIVTISAFVGVAALVGGVAMLVRGTTDNVAEDRLGVLTGKSKGRKSEAEATVIAKPLDDVPGAFEEFVSRFLNLSLLLEQDWQESFSPLLRIGYIAEGTGTMIKDHSGNLMKITERGYNHFHD